MLLPLPRSVCRSPSTEFGEKHDIAFRVSLTPAPGPDLGESHAIAYRNSYSCRKTLQIIPEIVRGEPIPASVGCRQRKRPFGSATSPHGTDPQIPPNPEWPAGKLDKKRGEPVNVPVSLARETKRSESAVHLICGALPREYKVGIGGLIDSSRVEIRAGSARKHRPDSRAPKCIAGRDGHVGEGRPLAQLQRGLPVRLGRRRRAAARPRSSVSDSRSRSR